MSPVASSEDLSGEEEEVGRWLRVLGLRLDPGLMGRGRDCCL